MMRIKNVVKVMNFHSLLRVDASKREAEAYRNVGEEITKINLYKVPDILYGGEMVYVEGFEFMKNYMDEYYDLPAEVQLIYEEMEQ